MKITKMAFTRIEIDEYNAHIIGFPLGSTPGLTREIVKAARQSWQIPRGVG
jgi:hypothetical protein